MRRTRFTKSTSLLTAVLHVVFSVLLATSGFAQAQAPDVDPPTIDLELVEQGVLGETQVFSATVTDNDQVASMTLHYRFGGESAYVSAPMSVISGTSIYTASVDTTNTAANVIQYYMEARDAGDNRTVQGFAFDPFERALLDEEAAPLVADSSPEATAAEPAAATSGLSTQRKVAYGVIGLLVVGGLASALGGGGGGAVAPPADEPGTVEGPNIVNVTILAPNPLQ